MFRTELNKHIAGSYFIIRIGFAALGILLPFVLWIGAGEPLKHSMSAYYYSETMRDWFVGLLFFLGATLVFYKGFTVFEDWALNFAGLFVIIMALNPESGKIFSVHGASAISFFALIVYVFIYRSLDTLSLMQDEKKRNRFKIIYRSLGGTIAVFIVIAFILSYLRSHAETTSSLNHLRLNIFIPEALAVFAFGLYWGIKGYEIKRTKGELDAIEGKLIVIEYGWSDLFEPINVEREPSSK